MSDFLEDDFRTFCARFCGSLSSWLGLFLPFLFRLRATIGAHNIFSVRGRMMTTRIVRPGKWAAPGARLQKASLRRREGAAPLKQKKKSEKSGKIIECMSIHHTEKPGLALTICCRS